MALILRQFLANELISGVCNVIIPAFAVNKVSSTHIDGTQCTLVSQA